MQRHPTFLLVALVLIVCCSARLASSQPPNIVMIISDDQFADDFGFMGNSAVQTPHIDQLAAKSARFVNGSVPTSVCSPSLATLLTGLYPHQHGIHYNHPPPGNSGFNRMTSRADYERTRSRGFQLIKNVDTLPRVLRDELGYRSLQTGKFWEGHYSNAGFTDGMTIFEPVPGQEFGGNRTLADGTLAAHGNGDWGLKIGRETMAPIEAFLDDRSTKPFFIWYAPYLPHQPHDSPERFYELYDKRSDIPKHRIPYYAAISQFDETVGDLVEMIEQRGLLESTLFVFVIDNGWEAGQTPQRGRPVEFAHTKNSKRSPFEPGLRTPILFRWDGIIDPATHDEPVSSVDILPTLYDLVELHERSAPLPGISLADVARSKSKLDPSRPIFGEIYPGDATSLGHPEKEIAYRWIKQNGFKLIVPHRHQDQAPWSRYLETPALFDLRSDPSETNNLFKLPEHRRRVKHLQTQLDEWWNGESPTLLLN